MLSILAKSTVFMSLHRSIGGTELRNGSHLVWLLCKRHYSFWLKLRAHSHKGGILDSNSILKSNYMPLGKPWEINSILNQQFWIITRCAGSETKYSKPNDAVKLSENKDAHQESQSDHHHTKSSSSSPPQESLKGDKTVDDQANSTTTTTTATSNKTTTRIDPKLFDYADELMDYLGEPAARKSVLILKIVLTIIAGLYFGAFLAKLGANLLEEYEIFVRGGDDDDD
ncbi:essential MCU regulator [Brevipalpus obovatus]|uniref:essential MCU regulator n=1 Tax=Brevipalpus obovatus TaxID=246614 RepID=UPI003D9EDB5A